MRVLINKGISSRSAITAEKSVPATNTPMKTIPGVLENKRIRNPKNKTILVMIIALPVSIKVA